MTDKRTLRAIKKMAKLHLKINALREKMSNMWCFDELLYWNCNEIYRNCTIEDDVLYDSKGEELSRDGRCMDENVPYFVNQSTGYCGDDFRGTMFVKVDNKNTFVAVDYEC